MDRAQSDSFASRTVIASEDNTGRHRAMLNRITVATAAAAACGLLLFGQCLALAQTQRLPVIALARSAVSGVDTPVSRASAWDKTNCTTRPQTVNITRPPAHGTTSLEQAEQPLPANTVRSGETGQCAGKPITTTIIRYKSNPGFAGIDTFSYESVTAAWIAPYDVAVAVSAADAVGGGAGAGAAPAAAAAAGGATYRMLIQSLPEMNGRCIDVPNRLFAEGMRLQMWDCNNSSAQIFVYDEKSQELKIDRFCVESWGGGNPQDAVGLGSCDGGAKQHWKIVPIKDHYQIVGVNNLCLDIRYGIKDGGAPLNVYTCGADNVGQLWTLVEAPQ
jgi:hypothetical protein